MNNQVDICIVGGGASGLAAALEAHRQNPEARILLLDKNDILGKKIRATGNGRCNITNVQAPEYERTVRLLEDCGIALRAYDSGLVYPYSESAADVADLLWKQVKLDGTEILLNSELADIQKQKNGDFRIRVEHHRKKGEEPKEQEGHSTLIARKVILATGGKAGPQYGTIGDGFPIARRLGHTVRSAVPVLTPIDCREDACDEVAGVRAKGTVTLNRKCDGEWKAVFTERGEIQFTKTGLSGICVFNMTRHMRFGLGEDISAFRVEVDLCPDLDVSEHLRLQCRKEPPGADFHEGSLPLYLGLSTVLKKSLASYVIRRTGLDRNIDISTLDEGEIEALAHQIHHLSFRPTGIHGWKEAQCTSGGVLRAELEDSGESRICPGIYIVGELQDYDGPCGGYNLNHAWISGSKAGRHAANAIRSMTKN